MKASGNGDLTPTAQTTCLPSFGEEINIAESAGEYYPYSETKTCEEYARIALILSRVIVSLESIQNQASTGPGLTQAIRISSVFLKPL